MKIVDLFSGTRSISKAFESRGHEVYSIEIDKRHQGISWYADILEVAAEDIIRRFGKPHVIWASPPCTTYSIAAISHHRTKEESGNLSPKSINAKIADDLVKHTIQLIAELTPCFFLSKIREAAFGRWILCKACRGTH